MDLIECLLSIFLFEYDDTKITLKKYGMIVILPLVDLSIQTMRRKKTQQSLQINKIQNSAKASHFESFLVIFHFKINLTLFIKVVFPDVKNI